MPTLFSRISEHAGLRRRSTHGAATARGPPASRRAAQRDDDGQPATPGRLYPDDRLSQVDMRFAKIIRFGSRRLDTGVNLYNLFNTNDTTTFDPNFALATNGATWLQPTAIVPPRFARFNVTFSF